MQKQVRFNGTPKQFAYAVNSFSVRFAEIGERGKNGLANVWLPYNVASSWSAENPSEITMQFRGRDVEGYGLVTAVAGATGDCVLFLSAQDEHWSKLEKWWELLCVELKQQGWIDEQKNSESAQPTPNEPTAKQAAISTHAETQSGRAKKITAAALIIIGVLIGILTNVASNTLPIEWKPFLWISWPLIGVLVLISIILLRWQ